MSDQIRWKRAREGFVESYCGRWRIRPLFWGRVNPQSFELLRDGVVIGTRTSQRDAKALARDVGDGPGERRAGIRRQVRRVHAEPDPEQVTDQVAWMALWPDGEVTRHAAAIELLREVKRRDQVDTKKADRRREAVIFMTQIDWTDVPVGFVPPTEADL